MKRPSKKIIIIGLVLVVIIGIALAIFNNSRPDRTQAPEKGGVPVITFIDKNEAFYNSVTFTDYTAVKYRLTDYVISQKGDPWTTVEVKDVKLPGQGSSKVTFKISIESLGQKDIVVEFDYGAKPFATFTIKEKAFTAPLYGGQS